jgi:hypothetical protein
MDAIQSVGVALLIIFFGLLVGALIRFVRFRERPTIAMLLPMTWALEVVLRVKLTVLRMKLTVLRIKNAGLKLEYLTLLRWQASAQELLAAYTQRMLYLEQKRDRLSQETQNARSKGRKKGKRVHYDTELSADLMWEQREAHIRNHEDIPSWTQSALDAGFTPKTADKYASPRLRHDWQDKSKRWTRAEFREFWDFPQDEDETVL